MLESFLNVVQRTPEERAAARARAAEAAVNIDDAERRRRMLLGIILLVSVDFPEKEEQETLVLGFGGLGF